MKKTGMHLFAGLVVGLGLGAMGCGDDESGNACAQANAILYEATYDACERQANCCYCACFENNPGSVANCTDCAGYPFAGWLADSPPCEGVEAQQAEGCLANEDACFSQQRGVVSMQCSF